MTYLGLSSQVRGSIDREYQLHTVADPLSTVAARHGGWYRKNGAQEDLWATHYPSDGLRNLVGSFGPLLHQLVYEPCRNSHGKRKKAYSDEFHAHRLCDSHL